MPFNRKLEFDRLLRLTEVLQIIPVSASTWWAWVAKGLAPIPIRLGRTTAWRHSDLLLFIESGMKERG